jgi:Holliday junction resolvase RusA-like endonuclease
MPMPDSWTAKKKAAMNQKPHQQTPDVDNLTKSLMDSIFGQDCAVWDIRATKVWGYEGAIEILET